MCNYSIPTIWLASFSPELITRYFSTLPHHLKITLRYPLRVSLFCILTKDGNGMGVGYFHTLTPWLTAVLGLDSCDTTINIFTG